MKNIVILIIIGLGFAVYILIDSKSRKSDPIPQESAEGIITKTYDTYKGGINDAKSAVSAIEERNQ